MGDDVRDLLPRAARGPPRQRAHLHHRQLCFVSCPPGHERGERWKTRREEILDAKPGSRAAEKRRARAVQNGTMRDRTQDLLAIAERLGNEVSGPKPAMARPRVRASPPRHPPSLSTSFPRTHSLFPSCFGFCLSLSLARAQGGSTSTNGGPAGPLPPRPTPATTRTHQSEFAKKASRIGQAIHTTSNKLAR